MTLTPTLRTTAAAAAKSAASVTPTAGKAQRRAGAQAGGQIGRLAKSPKDGRTEHGQMDGQAQRQKVPL